MTATTPNIAMLLTPPGSAAIAVVRIHGSGVPDLLRRHFSRPAVIGRCVHGNLTDGPRLIDDAVVVLADSETADLNLHGGPWVVRSALELARAEGFVIREQMGAPLSADAIDGASEIEKEVLAYLPLARTELGLRVLLAQQDAWKGLKASGGMDRNSIEPILADRTLHHLLHPPTVAIVGAANVGKSTLANQLFARERSITADVPGTTRDWVGEIANVNGLPILLVDTPGLRQTEDAIERTAIERSRDKIETADAIVLVLDASRPLEGEQSTLLAMYPLAIRVVNKSDHAGIWDIANVNGLATVATTGEGVEALRGAIVRSLCGTEQIAIDQPRCWTERQVTLLRRRQLDSF
jgi:small GTP-binding protein